MSSIQEIMKKIAKDHGGSIVQMGTEDYADTPRIPTSVFPVDLAMGGGFPMGRVSIVYGPESSNKTNLVLKAIAQGQKIYPDKKAVFVDAEHALDLKWAKKLGVDITKLVVVYPEYAEQAVDFIEAFLYADDVFMVALDSLAALSSQNEIESSAEKVSVGGPAIIIGKMFKKATVSFNRMRNQGGMPPAFIVINQIRNKIGVMYGNPETMPGGFAPKFAASMILRVYGKNEIDKAISTTMPAYKLVSCILQKWKVPILAINSEYKMAMIEGTGVDVGECDDWNTVSAYLKELDYLAKGEKAGWVMFGEPYKTLVECKARLYGDEALLREAKGQIIQELLIRQALPANDTDKGTKVDPETGEILQND